MPGSRLLAALAAAAMLSGPAAGAWRVAESPHFRVYAEMSAADLRKRVALLEDYRNLLGTFTSAQVDDAAPRLDIYIVSRIGQALPFDPDGSGAAGFYRAADQGIAAFALKDDAGQKILLHEYAHHHMFASTGQVYPTWYVEGFADYFMSAVLEPHRVEVGLIDEGRAMGLIDGFSPWQRVIDRSGRSGEIASYKFYSQSWLLTHYLFRTPGMSAKLNAHLKAIAAGEDPLVAFKTHITADLDQLGRTLRNYTGSRDFTYTIMRREPPAPVAITVRELPASADTLLLYRAWFDTHGPIAKEPKAALAKVQAAAARFPGDPLATSTLAVAELYLGDAAKAAALLQGLLAMAPDDADLMRLLALAMLKQDANANRNAARSLLVQAVRTAPGNWRAMQAYIHTHDIEHQPADSNLLDVAFLMWRLAPQVDGVVIDLATMPVHAGRIADAARLLEPVAFTPHRRNGRLMAAQLRDAALAGDKAAYVRLIDVRRARLQAGGDGEEEEADEPKTAR